MTLTKKMALNVLGLLFLVFLGTYLTTMSGIRTYFFQQLESNSQDTATSLGLSLSQAQANGDKASMLAMVQAIFDRGYFSAIEVKDLQGKILVSRVSKPESINVPSWFIQLVQWPIHSQSALVMKGWSQIGEVEVLSNPLYVYRALWSNALNLVYLYLLIAVISIILIYAFIHWLLTPLNRLKIQAQSIQSGNFVIETNIPKTPELRSVVLTVNRMVIKVKSFFEEQAGQMQLLRMELYQDSLTGLKNRRFYLQQLNGLLNDENAFFPGLIMIISLDGLDLYNKNKGYQEGDERLLEIARVCNEYGVLLSAVCVARLSGSNFAMIFPDEDANAIEKFTSELASSLEQLVQFQEPLKVVLAAAPYELHEPSGVLLERVDHLLNEVRKNSEGPVYVVNHDVNEHAKLSKHRLIDSLKSRQFFLYSQRVGNKMHTLHHEILVRMRGRDDEIFTAGYFMPMAEQLGLAYLVDQYVLKELKNHIFKEKNSLAVNISKDTLLSKVNSQAYLDVLAKMPKARRALIQIELNEQLVLSHLPLAKAFFEEIKKLGMKSGIDWVGLHFESMYYLSDLSISYIKLHGALFHDIDNSPKEQFTINYFCKMAKTLDLEVIATHIETKKQWDLVQSLNIPWIQGVYLSEPQPFVS